MSLRDYILADCAAFLRTSEAFGAFSNMASGYPFQVGEALCASSEAYYQAMRFPDHPDVQEKILAARSPKAAKIISREHLEKGREDWTEGRVKIAVMRHALRLRYAFNATPLGELYEMSGDRPIVEISWRDSFWGARPDNAGRAQGMNVLGRLHMELRAEIRNDPGRYLDRVEAPDVGSLLLLGAPIPRVQEVEDLTRQGSLSL